MAKPAQETNQQIDTREEVIRAMLDPGHEEADELGRTPPDAGGRDTAPHASPREQAAAPINIQNVDE
jgi:hypothetical protein